MRRTFNVSMLISIMLLLGAQQTFAQDKDDKKAAKTIAKVSMWDCKKLQKDGREINIKGIAGIVTMEFRVRKEKKTEKITDSKGNEKKKKVMEIINIGVNGWNDYRIVRLDKDEMILEHNLDDSIYRWTMIPTPKEKTKKK